MKARKWARKSVKNERCQWLFILFTLGRKTTTIFIKLCAQQFVIKGDKKKYQKNFYLAMKEIAMSGEIKKWLNRLACKDFSLCLLPLKRKEAPQFCFNNTLSNLQGDEMSSCIPDLSRKIEREHEKKEMLKWKMNSWNWSFFFPERQQMFIVAKWQLFCCHILPISPPNVPVNLTIASEILKKLLSSFPRHHCKTIPFNVLRLIYFLCCVIRIVFVKSNFHIFGTREL